jgi:hypothetical protein
MKCTGLATHTASYAGSTRLRGRSPFGEAKARVSITLRKSPSKRMDCRVKPGNDGSVDNSQIARADNHRRHRYINFARHVRAFGVRTGKTDDGIDTIEQWPR